MQERRSALVVIDMQNGFVNDRSRPVIPVVVDLVARWQRSGAPIVFTRYHNYPDSPFERLIGWSQLQDSPSVDLIPELAEAAETALAVVDKTIYSLFTTEAVALLEDRGWTDLVFCGIATESCVLKSAVDAFERGITPWIVTDGCASHAGPTAHEAGILVAGRFIGRGQLIRSSDVERLFHPEPRAI